MSNERDRDILDQVRIAAPCSARWEAMPGGERVRSCEQCGHKVYNLSAMSSEDAAALIREAEGRVCVRLYRRADGSVITQDCPKGLRAVRLRAARTATLAFTSLAAAFGGISLFARWSASQNDTPTTVVNYDPSTPFATPIAPVMGTPAPPEPHATMGEMTIAPTPAVEHVTMGKVARFTPLPMVAPSPDPEKTFLPHLETPSIVREDPFSPLPLKKVAKKQSHHNHREMQ